MAQEVAERRLILLGKVGAGKSNTGNAILQGNHFESRPGWQSVTNNCTFSSKNRNGYNYIIFDTPGAYAPNRDDEVFHESVQRCLCVTSPGFHALLLVISAEARLTPEDYKLLKELERILGEKAYQYCIIIFTKLDETELKENLAKSEEMRELCEKCKNRYICFGKNNDIPQEYIHQFDDMLKELILKNRENPYFENQLYNQAGIYLEKDAKRISKEKGISLPDARFMARQEAAEGRSPHDDKLLKLTKELCCIIL